MTTEDFTTLAQSLSLSILVLLLSWITFMVFFIVVSSLTFIAVLIFTFPSLQLFMDTHPRETLVCEIVLQMYCRSTLEASHFLSF